MNTLLVEARDGVTVISLNRPKALNALNHELLSELRTVLDEIRSDNHVRAVVLTGTGDRAFAAGADITELQSLSQDQGRDLARYGQSVFRRLEHLGKPVIAAVNGFALGGGCELAMACTFRVASDNAKFGLPELGLGLIPGYSGTQRLARLVGKGAAMEVILTGDMVDASRALQLGLVNHVYPIESLLDEAVELAQKTTKKAPRAVRFALEAVNRGMDMSQNQGDEYEATLFGILASSEDAREGVSAFLEKRKPAFKGR
ncbi:MAG: enoyl-CoA hydratase/isomerase family protein [Acidobacteria bacterium]|nr:enoyl-CoA hydratase/isomerase family protein [Acidobacteriota bacterium]